MRKSSSLRSPDELRSTPLVALCEVQTRKIGSLQVSVVGLCNNFLEIAFGWLLSHKPVASVIAGASRPEQVRANATAANWQLTSDDLARIDKIVAQQCVRLR